jgi:hypothetical protein
VCGFAEFDSSCIFCSIKILEEEKGLLSLIVGQKNKNVKENKFCFAFFSFLLLLLVVLILRNDRRGLQKST